MDDRLVDFVDRGLELFAGEVVVAGEAGFKGVQFLFKVGDVDALRFDQRELGKLRLRTVIMIPT